MASTIQVRVDDELKRKSDSLFKDLGTDTTTAIIFLTQAVAANGFPFEIKRSNNIYQSMSEEDVLKRLEDAREHAEQGTCIDADAFVADMRTKYGI